MGSFKLSAEDGGYEATRAGCLLAVVAGSVTLAGFVAGLPFIMLNPPIRLPAWIDPKWLDGDGFIVRYLAMPVAVAPGLIIFWLGSRWLKRKHIDVWRKAKDEA